MATQHQSKPSYLGDPMDFCFPTPSSYCSSTSTNSCNYVDAGSSPEIHIERVGSVLIKSGYSKVQPFSFECLSSQSSENRNDDYLIPVVLEPPSIAIKENISKSSFSTDLSGNASICSVNDIAENKIFKNKKEKAEGSKMTTMQSYSESNAESQESILLTAKDIPGKQRIELDHTNNKSLQSSLTNNQNKDNKSILDNTNYPVVNDVTSSIYSSGTCNKPETIVNTTNSRKSSYSVTSALSNAIKQDYEVKKLPRIASTNSFKSRKLSFRGKNKENISIELPRRSSKRMLIYKKLGVEPNGEALLRYVKSQQSLKTQKPKSRSKNLDNLSKMIQELQELQETIENEQNFESESSDSNERKDLIFDSASTKAFSNLKNRNTSLLSLTSRSNVSPLKERSISQSTRIIEQEAPPMKYQVVPFNEHNSLSRRRTTKLKRSMSKLNTVDEPKLETLPHLPEAKKEEVCELKRSPAIRRKSKFIENVIKVIKLIIRAPKKAYRNVSVKSKRLFAFGKLNKGQKKKNLKKKTITISCPTQVDIKDTSFGPEVLSTFGNYGGGSRAKVPTQKRNSVRSRIASTRTQSDVTESDLLSYWTCLLKTSISTRTELKLDLEKMSKLEHITSLRTNTRRPSMKSHENSEMLINKYILSDVDGAITSESDYCSLCGSGFTEDREEQACSQCERGSIYHSQMSLATLSSSSLGESTYQSGSGSSSISSMEEIYDDYSLISDAEDGGNLTGSISPLSECSSAKSDPAQLQAVPQSLHRNNIRPSMRFTNLQHILKNNGSVKQRSTRVEQDIGAADSWRPKLFGPRPMPEKLSDMIAEE